MALATDGLEIAARLELRVGGDVGDVRDRIAEHLALMRLDEKFAFGDAGEEFHHRCLEGIDLRLIRLGRIETRPIDGGERPELGAALAHPGDELLVGAPSGDAAVKDEIEPAVSARPEHAVTGARDRAAGHEGARPLRV